MIHTSHSQQETEKIAHTLISYLSQTPHSTNTSIVASHATVIGLSGDLGSGKTTFTQCVAKILGIEGHITSPTFVIQKKYPINPSIDLPNFPFKNLLHIDAYRLESARELENLNWKNDLEDPTLLILIEWPERVAEILPPATLFLKFSFISPHVRTIEFPDMMN